MDYINNTGLKYVENSLNSIKTPVKELNKNTQVELMADAKTC